MEGGPLLASPLVTCVTVREATTQEAGKIIGEVPSSSDCFQTVYSVVITVAGASVVIAQYGTCQDLWKEKEMVKLYHTSAVFQYVVSFHPNSKPIGCFCL